LLSLLWKPSQLTLNLHMNNENDQTPLNDFEHNPLTSEQADKKRFPAALSSVSNKGIVIGLIVFLILLLIGFMASRSLPGESLYAVKTQVLERLDAAVQFGSKNKAANQVHNMETRLSETKELSEKGDVSEEAIAALHDRVLTHAEVLKQLVEQESSDFSMEDRLFTLNNFASVAGAMETIGENDPDLLTFGDQMEDVRRDTVNIYKDTADIFVQSTTPDNALEFIKNSLGEVSGKLSNEAGISEETIDDAEEYIYRLSIAVKEKDYTKAIYSVGEAARFIKIEEYTGAITPLAQAPSESNASSTPSDDSGTSTVASTTPTTTLPL
jgi:hypothetical protein